MPLKLGIVWYLIPTPWHEEDKLHGKHIRYLTPTPKNKRNYAACDPALFNAMQKLVEQDKRAVRFIPTAGIFPKTTAYYDAPLSFPKAKGTRPALSTTRLDYRHLWISQALEVTVSCDIVFVDPDNGLECKVKRQTRNGPKYVCFDELVPYCQRGQSLVVYHHLNRSGPATEQIAVKKRELERHLYAPTVIPMRFKRGTSRVFFVIPAATHEQTIIARLSRLMESPWSAHFEYSAA